MANILVIDDEKDILRLMEVTLKKTGHTVTVANGAPEALQLIEHKIPDLVIVDIMMPDMTGYEFTRRVRQVSQLTELPIIIYSARFQPIDKQTALDVGATAYLPKTLSPPEMAKEVEKILAQFQADTTTSGGKNIGFLSLKGGAGVTTLVVNVAVALMMSKKTAVSLVDFTPLAGHAGIMLGLRPTHDLQQLLQNPKPLNDALLKQFSVGYKGIRLFASPLVDRGNQTHHTVADFTAELSQRFKYNIFDLSNMIDDQFEATLEALNTLVIVMNPQVPSLQSTYALLQLLSARSFPSDKIVIVQNNSCGLPGLKTDILQKTINRPIDAEIPFEAGMLAGISSGKPLLLSNPKSQAATAIARLAVSLTKR